MSSDAALISASPQHAAKALVRSYLEAMEQRDLAAASALLAPGFRMLFPGGRAFDSLSALVQAARGRYRSANKRYERFDVLIADALATEHGEHHSDPRSDPTCVVYCYGMLYGELLSGETYDNIRFIDRFSVRGGKLIDQMVWNDMAEVLGSKLPAL